MLHEFLTSNHQEILARARAKIAVRPAPRPTEAELRDGVPLFLDQLIARLRGSLQAGADMNASATRHGRAMQRVGITVSALIYGYGDVCQAVTELASEQGVSISAEEYQLFNRCLDDVMAESVTEFASERERSLEGGRTEHLGAHGGEDGAIAAIGTGAVYVISIDGKLQTFGGWGFMLSDQGSGADLGRVGAEVDLDLGALGKAGLDVHAGGAEAQLPVAALSVAAAAGAGRGDDLVASPALPQADYHSDAAQDDHTEDGQGGQLGAIEKSYSVSYFDFLHRSPPFFRSCSRGRRPNQASAALRPLPNHPLTEARTRSQA